MQLVMRTSVGAKAANDLNQVAKGRKIKIKMAKEETEEATTVEIKTKTGARILQPTGLFINNKFITSKLSLETVNPRSGEVICSVSAAGKEDVDLAVNAAADALPGWKKVRAMKC
jgi:hypothetical protein